MSALYNAVLATAALNRHVIVPLGGWCTVFGLLTDVG